MIRLLALVAVAVVQSTSFASTSRDNHNARILAGLEIIDQAPTRNTLASLINSPVSLFEPKSRLAMREFFATSEPSTLKTRGLIYLFGGPDVLFPQVIFPNYERMLLVGLETPGVLPDAANLDTRVRQEKINEIANAYSNAITKSYFITSHMGRELREFGTTTMIAAGLVVQGFEILSITRVSLDQEGNLREDTRGAVKGVTVHFQRPNKSLAEVTYLQFDLSDGNLRANPQFEQFVKRQGYDSAFYKAASFVSHIPSFSGLNRLVQSQVRLLIQADDGIPVSDLNAFSSARGNAWSVNLYGVYTAPHDMFKVSTQPTARALFAQSICGSQASMREAGQDLWRRVWGIEACKESMSNLPASLAVKAQWKGYIPFRFGYAAVSGPSKILPWSEMPAFGTLMVLER